MRQSFTNPATGEVYQWAVNHTTEDPMVKTRAITDTANTGLTGRVRQQGDDGSLTLKLHGTIVTRDQLRQFWKWYQLCATQTIYFTDFDGQQYEVQITSFQPQRIANLSRVNRDPSMTQHHYTYEMDLEVYSFRAGDLHDMGVVA